jgi:hypothetical protein
MSLLGRFGTGLPFKFKRGSRTIGTEDQLRLLDLLKATIDRETSDPVERQIAIELLILSHCSDFADVKDAKFVADSMNKHVKQMMDHLAS